MANPRSCGMMTPTRKPPKLKRQRRRGRRTHIAWTPMIDVMSADRSVRTMIIDMVACVGPVEKPPERRMMRMSSGRTMKSRMTVHAIAQSRT